MKQSNKHQNYTTNDYNTTHTSKNKPHHNEIMTEEEIYLISEAIDFYNLNHLKGKETKKKLIKLKKRIKLISLPVISNCKCSKVVKCRNCEEMVVMVSEGYFCPSCSC